MTHIKFLVLAAACLFMLFSCDITNTGDLKITCYDDNGDRLSGAEVFIFYSQEDLDDSRSFDSRVSNEQGEVFFSNLEPGTYYFDYIYINNNAVLTTQGSATVSANRTKEASLRP